MLTDGMCHSTPPLLSPAAVAQLLLAVVAAAAFWAPAAMVLQVPAPALAAAVARAAMLVPLRVLVGGMVVVLAAASLTRPPLRQVLWALAASCGAVAGPILPMLLMPAVVPLPLAHLPLAALLAKLCSTRLAPHPGLCLRV
jgi:hypothetical protein